MKRSALRLLVCPRCAAGLTLGRVAAEQGLEIVDGALDCRACGATYPIRRGVPRFVDDGAYAASFGRQWNWFRTVQLDSHNGTDESARTLAATTGWTADDYHGRLVLDAGVGAGRFAEIVARDGGEVVGVDLTTAIDAAYANIGRHPRVHLVQADIFAMPFAPATFDLAYSIGVLHHTPDTAAAFRCVAATVKKGGGLAVYLYHRYGIRWFTETLRRLTTRLPAGAMLPLTALAIPLHYVYRIPALGTVLQIVCPISGHPNWRWRWLDTFDWYTPRYQWKFLYPEVHRWFRAGGFHEIDIFDDPIRMRGVKTAEPTETSS
ncbi:MAG TPA: methyltransferase domain-containing protein [Methylomirabilota bacterium]|jgi:SAM-dependent methyltransferase